jgi:hypothetical protein
MDTWPISLRPAGPRTLIGIPDRLGDGASPWSSDSPSLEEIAGDAWCPQILARLLPPERTWAWWTRTEVLNQSRLPTARASHRIDLACLDAVATRRLLLQGMSLAVIPAGHSAEQEIVFQWANQDTEQTPDQLWTAPDGADVWDTDRIAAWCRDRRRWSDLEQPAERIVIMFDGRLYGALPTAAAIAAFEGLRKLAEGWGLRVIEGRPEDAWI